MSEKNTKGMPDDSRRGLVVRNTGAHYVVELDGAARTEVNCRIKGNFRIRGIRTTNPVAVGDRVRISASGPDERRSSPKSSRGATISSAAPATSPRPRT